MTSAEDLLLQALLAAEHAAVYAYGVLGARLVGPQRDAAGAADDAHRARRDEVTARLLRAGRAPAATRPAYDVTAAGPVEALALAVRLEEGLGVRWRDLVSGTDDAQLRTVGVGGLVETAVRAAQWRQAQGVPVVTVALPGLS